MKTRQGSKAKETQRTDEALPFLISDDIKIDVKGLRFGTREQIVEAHCRACTYDRARKYVDYPAGTETLICNGCGHVHGAEYDYQP